MSDSPKRLWFQFSLRTLLLVMMVATVAFGGWVQYRRQRAQQKREEVAAILRSGGYQYIQIGPRTWLEEHFDEPTGFCWKIPVLKSFKDRVRWPGGYPPLLHLFDEKAQATDDAEKPRQKSPRCEILP